MNTPATLKRPGVWPKPSVEVQTMNSITKKCSKCGESKSLDQFVKDKKSKDGLSWTCRTCDAAYQRAYRERMGDVYREKRRQYVINNLEKVAVRSHRHYLSKKEELLSQSKMRYEQNKDEINSKRRARRNENTDKFRDQDLQYRFGVTLHNYREMLNKQNGVCAICGKPETAKSNKGKLRLLSVDHDHRTGIIRGLLCSRCNTAMGLLLDDISILRAAIRYLTMETEDAERIVA